MVLWHQSEANTTKAAPLRCFRPKPVFLMSRGEWPSPEFTIPDANFDSCSSAPVLCLVEMGRAAKCSQSYYDVAMVILRALEQQVFSNLVERLSAMALQFSYVA